VKLKGRWDQVNYMAGKANLLALGIIALLLLGGAALIIYQRISLGALQLQDSYLLFGTQVDLTVRGPSRAQAERGLEACFQEMKRIQTLMNVHAEDSEISRLNRDANEEWVKADPELYSLIQRALEISKASQGAFDCTVGPLVKIWRDARAKGLPPSIDEIKPQLNRVGYTYVALDPQGEKIRFLKKGMSLDLGGIAKGYALDAGKKALLREGIRQALLNAGGDVLALGGKGRLPWKVGIQDPRDRDSIMGILEVRDEAVVTSGDYERFFMHDGHRYHHILDPITGYPAERSMSVTVVGPRAEEADALATAAFVMGARDGLALIENTPGFEGLIMDHNGGRHLTPGFQDRVKWSP
jgi:thiamine biosynthesis lipoprotein